MQSAVYHKMAQVKKLDPREATDNLMEQIGWSGEFRYLFQAAGVDWHELSQEALRYHRQLDHRSKKYEEAWADTEWTHVWSHLADDSGRLLFLKLPQFAERKDVSLTTARNWITSGRLNAENGLFRGYRQWWVDIRKFDAQAQTLQPAKSLKVIQGGRVKRAA